MGDDEQIDWAGRDLAHVLLRLETPRDRTIFEIGYLLGRAIIEGNGTALLDNAAARLREMGGEDAIVKGLTEMKEVRRREFERDHAEG